MLSDAHSTSIRNLPIVLCMSIMEREPSDHYTNYLDKMIRTSDRVCGRKVSSPITALLTCRSLGNQLEPIWNSMSPKSHSILIQALWGWSPASSQTETDQWATQMGRKGGWNWFDYMLRLIMYVTEGCQGVSAIWMLVTLSDLPEVSGGKEKLIAHGQKLRCCTEFSCYLCSYSFTGWLIEDMVTLTLPYIICLIYS